MFFSSVSSVCNGVFELVVSPIRFETRKPYGREADLHGYPLKFTEIAASLEGTCYVTRQSVHSVASIRKTKKAIRKAFENSMNGKGASLVEVVSTCNAGWKLSPEKANQWMEDNMFKFYPLGDLKDTATANDSH